MSSKELMIAALGQKKRSTTADLMKAIQAQNGSGIEDFYETLFSMVYQGEASIDLGTYSLVA